MFSQINVLVFLSFWFLSVKASPAPENCNRNLMAGNGQTGDISSPGYPNKYAHHSDCVYTIGTVSPSSHVKVEFETFSIEDHANCAFDYLEIYDGPSVDSPLHQRYCGSTKPEPFSSSGRYVTLKFVSDSSVNELGFLAHYSIGCSFHKTATSDILSSPGYPANYPDSSDCMYTIEPPSGSQFLVNVLQMSIEDSPDCAYDYLEVNNGKNGNFNKKLCGSHNAFKMLITGTSLQLHFISDDSVSRPGFQIQYKVIESCATDNGGCSNTCTDVSKGKVACSCPTGFVLDDTAANCVDVDECVSNPCGEVCTNIPGSYQCSCSTDGYILSPDLHTCTDMTCKQDNGGCEHICQPMGPAQYHCQCHRGYKLAADSHNCTDIDECETDNPKYQHKCDQICHNEPGSYYCGCGSGYQLSSNQRSCEDIQECEVHYEQCAHSCIDVPGGWKCSCDPGYRTDPDDSAECNDIDECAEGLAPKICVTCTNFEGGYDCTCPTEGYISNDNQTDCIDINECNAGNGGCQQLCLNKPGGFRCACHLGYKATYNGSSECQDINECATNNGNGPCDHYCENLAGSFECSCLPGFKLLGDQLTCMDINECEDASICPQKCINTPGSHQCGCFDGYDMTEGVCTDRDECNDNPCTSHEDSNCVNSIGSFTCTCPSGYDLVNRTQCVDIDECATNDHQCEQVCNNIPGSFQCNCDVGYVKLNGACVDINECSGKNPCQQHCINSIGSYFCHCDPGYYLLEDDHQCSDVDECADAIHNCEQKCINQIGTHKCACNPGYQLNADNNTCSDINECEDGTAGCSHHCVNFNGGFICHCDPGFKIAADNKTCIDRNECAENNGGCDHICTNLPGSYKCGCDPGYTFGGNQSTCVDVNECSNNNGNCSHTCINSEGSYSCECPGNYKLGDDERTCSLCPTCDEFTTLKNDVGEMKGLHLTLNEVLATLRRLGATASDLEQRVQQLEQQAAGN